MANVYDFTVKDRKGNEVSLREYAGKVLLIVNTATRCGFTPHYDPLEAMYKEFRDQGFEILDFPCNQFGQQAPGTDEEIHSFCVLNYKTAFPQFAKVEVNGENAAPLFRFLVANTAFKGFPQDGKMPGNGGGSDVKMFGDLSGGLFPFFQQVQDFPPGRVRQRFQGLLDTHGNSSLFNI